MGDHETEDRPIAGGDQQRDVLGELIRAAGRRPAPTTGSYERVLAASKDAWRRKVRSRRRRQWAYALAATLAAVAIGLTTIQQLVPQDPIAFVAVVQGDVSMLSPSTDDWQDLTDPSIGIVPGTRLRTRVGGRASFDLARGASVRVNAETELAFISSEEIELIAGMIYVDSGVGVRTAQFEIATEFGTVRDIGTQFEVNASSAELRVRVREGAVQLFQSGARPRLESTAGEEMRVDSAGAVQRNPFSTHDPEWAWAEALSGLAEIEGMSVLDFVNWVAREIGRPLRFGEPGAELQARSVMLHATAQDLSALSPMQALSAILPTTDFEYELQSDGALLIRRSELAR